MKVDFSTVHPCRIGWPERVRIKNSPAARRAYATRLHALLGWFAGIAVGRLLSDPQVDPRFDVSAIGAESFRSYLGEITAHPADLFGLLRSSVEETQSCIEHRVPLR
jgi:hypothetical protein